MNKEIQEILKICVDLVSISNELGKLEDGCGVDYSNVITNLHNELRQYDKKVKMQDHIIDTQQDIINAFCELVGMINDKE